MGLYPQYMANNLGEITEILGPMGKCRRYFSVHFIQCSLGIHPIKIPIYHHHDSDWIYPLYGYLFIQTLSFRDLTPEISPQTYYPIQMPLKPNCLLVTKHGKGFIYCHKTPFINKTR